VALFNSVSTVVHGWGTLASLADAVPARCRKVVLVTGSASARAGGLVARCEELLGAAGITCDLCDGIEPEPSLAFVDEVRAKIGSVGADCVIGAGGGSVLDVAKAAAGLAGCGRDTAYYHAGEAPEARGIPFVAIPTTSGTGSEATPNSVLTDPGKGVKKSIRHPSFLAVGVVLDPQLTASCPPGVTASSGLDAFVQAVESFASLDASPLSKALSVEACRLIARSLIDAYRDGADRQARTDMAYGSYMAGVALANARLGAVHGLAHPLGVRLGVPHGLMCGILLPYALRFNYETVRERYSGLERALGSDVLEVTEEFRRRIDVPRGLSSYALDRGEFAAIADEAVGSGSMKANPRPMTRADVLALLDELVSC